MSIPLEPKPNPPWLRALFRFQVDPGVTHRDLVVPGWGRGTRGEVASRIYQPEFLPRYSVPDQTQLCVLGSDPGGLVHLGRAPLGPGTVAKGVFVHHVDDGTTMMGLLPHVLIER